MSRRRPRWLPYAIAVLVGVLVGYGAAWARASGRSAPAEDAQLLAQLRSENQVLAERVRQLEARLAEGTGSPDEELRLERQSADRLAARLAQLLLAELQVGNVELLRQLAGEGEPEIWVQLPRAGEAVEESDRLEDLLAWVGQAKPVDGGERWFPLEGSGGYHNVVVRMRLGREGRPGYLWFQFDEQAQLTKVFALLTDPREQAAH